MSNLNWQPPLFEQMEPRLLLSASPVPEEIDLPAFSEQCVTGGLDVGESQMYVFTAAASGYVYMNMGAAEGSGVDSYLEAFNSGLRRIARNNNASRYTQDSRIRLRVSTGRTYYVRARGAAGTDGDYELTLTSRPYDDYGNTAEAARALRVRRSGSTSARGRINCVGDTDWLSYTARDDGLVRVRMLAYGRGNKLVGSLGVYDAAGNLITSQVAEESHWFELSFSALKGQTYYLEASGGENTTGRYLVKVLPMILQEFIDAEEVDLPAFSEQSVTGGLDVGGTQMYKFTATASGYVYLNMKAAEGSEIDSYLEVFNPGQRRIARNSNANRYTQDSRIRLRVRAGRTYYVRARAAGGTEGDYELTLTSRPYDDYGNTAEAARALRVRRNGSTAARGRINCIGDTDYFSYTARGSGLVQVQMIAYGRWNKLSGMLNVYDAAGDMIASDHGGVGGTSALSFSAVKGQTYYMAASSDDNSTGRYLMKVLPIIPQEFIDAEEVDVPAYGEETAAGALDVGGTKMYKFTAATSAYLYLDMAAADGSAIDSYLEVFNSARRRIARNNNASRYNRDSRVRIRVRAGQTYYVRARAARGTEGDYELTFTSRPNDDAGNDIDHAAYLQLESDGSRQAHGKVNYAGDIDVLEIVAPVTGEMTVTAAAPGGDGSITPRLRADDSTGEQLVIDEDGDAACTVTFGVVEGETYYLRIASLDDNTGRYELMVSTDTDVDPDPAPDPDPDPDPVPPDDPTPGELVTGWISEEPGGYRLIVAGTDSSDIITLSVSGSVTTLTYASGSLDFAGVFDDISIYGFGGDDVIRMDYSIAGSGIVYAGEGNDTVYDNSLGAAGVYGGAGDDLLISLGGGVDSLWGQAGCDSFWVDMGDSLGDADSAEYDATAVHRITQFYQPYSAVPGSADYVSMEIAGQNFRDPTPTSYGRAWVNFASNPLFADGPEHNDIRQGSVGDCYFLACLASMSDSDPNVIRQMVTALGDGTYAVRFFRGGQASYLRLDADLPVYSGSSLSYAKLTPDGETWVAIVEKAYCHFRYGQNSYASISGGWMSTVFQEMTNRPTTTMWTGGSQASLASFIISALDSGHAATLGSYGNAPSPIVGSHAYMLKSIEFVEGEAIVTVYNPWGVDGKTYDSNYSDGLLRLDLSQVQACFSAIVISLA